jgi:hypothetical protein
MIIDDQMMIEDDVVIVKTMDEFSLLVRVDLST